MKGAAKMKENKTIKIITMITGILTVLLGFYAVVRPMRTFCNRMDSWNASLCKWY